MILSFKMDCGSDTTVATAVPAAAVVASIKAPPRGATEQMNRRVPSITQKLMAPFGMDNKACAPRPPQMPPRRHRKEAAARHRS